MTLITRYFVPIILFDASISLVTLQVAHLAAQEA